MKIDKGKRIDLRLTGLNPCANDISRFVYERVERKTWSKIRFWLRDALNDLVGDPFIGCIHNSLLNRVPFNDPQR